MAFLSTQGRLFLTAFHRFALNPLGMQNWKQVASSKNLCNILNTVLSHCLRWISTSLPTSQLISRYSSFTVNVSVAH